MNLQTISDRYTAIAVEAAEAPEYALGKPKRAAVIEALNKLEA